MAAKPTDGMPDKVDNKSTAGIKIDAVDNPECDEEREVSFVSASHLVCEEAETFINEVLNSNSNHSTSSSSSSSSVITPEKAFSPIHESQSKVACITKSFTAPFSEDYLFMIKRAKEVALTAIKQKRTFTILGPYPYLRSSLKRRGWVEKYNFHVLNVFYGGPQALRPKVKKKKRTHRRPVHIAGNDDGDSNNSDEDEPESDNNFNRVVSRLLKDIPPTFIWTIKRDDIDFKFLNRNQIVNHYCKASSFTTKVGLCQHLRSLPWFDSCHPNDFFPRCYQLYNEDDREDFIENFYISAAASIVKLYCEGYLDHCTRLDLQENQEAVDGRTLAISKSSAALSDAVEIAIRHLQLVIRSYSDEFLDYPAQVNDITTSYQKKSILSYARTLSTGKETFSKFSERLYAKGSQIIHKILSLNFIQEPIEGTGNIWIMKPGAKSRGRGVVVQYNLEEILRLANNSREEKWVVQKYIETPFLVHDTKFDIRQWFMVTDWNPLTLYFYQDSYLRFGSKPFNLQDNDPSIHLCNNSIQKKYMSGSKSENTKSFADGNMWTSSAFKDYLAGQGRADVWSKTIYPGMKKAIQRVMMTIQDIIEDRKNSFELYGADFMLDKNHNPWLIEINCSPAMGGTTRVTEQLCSEVLEDCLKVIIDRRESKNSSTGKWELIYKQPIIAMPPYIGVQLAIEGKYLPKPILRRKNTIDRERVERDIMRAAPKVRRPSTDKKSVAECKKISTKLSRSNTVFTEDHVPKKQHRNISSSPAPEKSGKYRKVITSNSVKFTNTEYSHAGVTRNMNKTEQSRNNSGATTNGTDRSVQTLPNINKAMRTQAYNHLSTIAIRPVACIPPSEMWKIKNPSAPVSNLLKQGINPYQMQQIMSKSIKQSHKFGLLALQNRYSNMSPALSDPPKKVEFFELNKKKKIKKFSPKIKTLAKLAACPHCEPIKTNKHLFLNLLKGNEETTAEAAKKSPTPKNPRPKKQFRVSLNQIATVSEKIIDMRDKNKTLKYVGD